MQAPKLFPVDEVGVMKNGSVIVDLVAKMATQSPQILSINLCLLLDVMGKGFDFLIDKKNEIIYGSLAVAQGVIKQDPN
ncbi:MAG: hypothetical protein EZS28_015375 [Streblomastix strix]|uniref:Uncharacterized protein n=1 Tax=Streblomastix strix TaxID=222440 RepID=A0A5J4W323_9EUKA|nr:MAG: hypothetical protein EZS28_015375 [Streblomastix strix]